MSLERPLFRGNTERFELHLDRRGELGKGRPAFYSRPEDAWAARAGEKTKPRKTHRDWIKVRNSAERRTNLLELFGGNLADEFQRDVGALQLHPTRAGTGLPEPLRKLDKRRAHCLGHIQRHKEAHAIPHLSSLPRRARKTSHGGRK